MSIIKIEFKTGLYLEKVMKKFRKTIEPGPKSKKCRLQKSIMIRNLKKKLLLNVILSLKQQSPIMSDKVTKKVIGKVNIAATDRKSLSSIRSNQNPK